MAVTSTTTSTPQEKKALSYERDRRNAYLENAKSSRKNIPLRKRLVNKANRHADRQALAKPTAEDAEGAEDRLIGARRNRWRKKPDIPLGEYVESQRKWAQQRVGRTSGDRPPRQGRP